MRIGSVNDYSRVQLRQLQHLWVGALWHRRLLWQAPSGQQPRSLQTELDDDTSSQLSLSLRYSLERVQLLLGCHNQPTWTLLVTAHWTRAWPGCSAICISQRGPH